MNGGSTPMGDGDSGEDRALYCGGGGGDVHGT